MRNTKQKDLILNIININSCHMTAIEVYKEAIKSISNISLGTVYRNLNNLVDLKKIRRIKMPNNIDRFDKNIVHSHIICNKCGKIDDIFEEFNIEIPTNIEYDVSDYDLCFNGICNKCKEKENKKWN